MRFVVWYLCAAAAIWFLQVLPVTGVFLLFLQAGYSIAILANLMLMHIAWTARRTRRHAWLLLPIAAYTAWFVYIGLAIQSGQRPSIWPIFWAGCTAEGPAPEWRCSVHPV